MIVYQHQIDAIESSAHEELVTRLCTFAREHLDQLTAHLSEAALHQRVEEDMAAAKSFGIESPRGFLHFMMIALLTDRPRLYQYHMFADSLRAAGFDIEEKLSLFIDNLKAELASAAEREEAALSAKLGRS